MTTILATETLMIADRQATLGGTILRLPSGGKIRRLPNGNVLGIAGNAADLERVFAWFNSDQKGDEPKDLDIHGLLLTPDGAFMLEDSVTGFGILLPAAIGSGASFAIGALAAGASPEQAMKIAADHDAFTGQTFDQLMR